MANPDFLQNVRLPDLGFGAATMMWGFRACALGHSQCGCLVGGFERIFGSKQGPLVLRDMVGLARIFGNDGRRRVTVAMPGCIGITLDEGALLRVFNTAQSGEEAACDRHLRWLLAKEPNDHMRQLTKNLAIAYLDRGLLIQAPASIPAQTAEAANEMIVDLASIRAAGNA